MNKDTVVGIVGAVILLVAMVGVFRYEGSQAQSTLGSRAFDLTWSSANAAGPTLEETTALGQSTEAPLAIATANLTKVQLTVTWTATNGRDTLKVTVTPPAGSGLEPQEQEGDGGSLTFSFDIPNTVPPASSVFGNSEADAKNRLASQNTKTAGTGDWTVQTDFTAASGIVPIAGAPPVQQDQQVTWTAKTQLTTYTPVLKPKAG